MSAVERFAGYHDADTCEADWASGPPWACGCLERLQAILDAYLARVESAMRAAADELNDWDDTPSAALGGVSPGGLVHHALEAALQSGDRCEPSPPQPPVTADHTRERRELADFEPSTSHVHGCAEQQGCDCTHHLYAIAQDAEAHLADMEARLAGATTAADDWEEVAHSKMARQAAAEALADEWSGKSYRAPGGRGTYRELGRHSWYGDRLRAVLHPDPSEVARDE